MMLGTFAHFHGAVTSSRNKSGVGSCTNGNRSWFNARGTLRLEGGLQLANKQRLLRVETSSPQDTDQHGCEPCEMTCSARLTLIIYGITMRKTRNSNEYRESQPCSSIALADFPYMINRVSEI